MKQVVWLFCFLGFVICFAGCSGISQNVQTNTAQNKVISVVSYNAQEFFDGKRDGNEYSEYKKSAGWGVETYKIRLERLCKLITLLNADIYVFQEIENEGILQDISNYLSGDSWRAKDLWTYSCFSKEEGAAIGNAVLSKYPLENMKVHGLDVRSETTKQPSVRPLMEVTALCGEKLLKLYVNHWKSKSGGEEETELWRDWQEQVLAEVLLKEKIEAGENFTALICGDFNRDIGKFCLNSTTENSEGNIILRGLDFSEEEEKNIAVNSPWLDVDGKAAVQKGSYFFNNSWERIDHIFSAGKIRIEKFEPVVNELWTDEKGIPEGYKLFNGQGFSDHLPVKAFVEFL